MCSFTCRCMSICVYMYGGQKTSFIIHYSGDVLLFLFFRLNFSGLEPTNKSRLMC